MGFGGHLGRPRGYSLCSGSGLRLKLLFLDSQMSLSCSWISVLGFKFLSVDLFSTGAFAKLCEGVDVFLRRCTTLHNLSGPHERQQRAVDEKLAVAVLVLFVDRGGVQVAATH